MITVEQVLTIVKETPNDMELGAKIRELYFKNNQNG
jgi:hypothetical protein|tara:strand:- start:239 stop:346 length:108 start_codon:yes stop_codon:yes gene_type:complete